MSAPDLTGQSSLLISQSALDIYDLSDARHLAISKEGFQSCCNKLL